MKLSTHSRPKLKPRSADDSSFLRRNRFASDSPLEGGGFDPRSPATVELLSLPSRAVSNVLAFRLAGSIKPGQRSGLVVRRGYLPP